MQDLASEFSKNFLGVMPPEPHSRRGQPPPAPNTQPGLWPGAGHKRLSVGTQTLVPLKETAHSLTQLGFFSHF